MLERFCLIWNVLVTLHFLTLCASVGNKRGFSIVDARCNHEVYNLTLLHTLFSSALGYFLWIEHPEFDTTVG